MIIVVGRADMLRAAQVANVVESRKTNPILANIVIKDRGDRLAMTATDLDKSVRATAPGPHRDMLELQIVRGMRDKEIRSLADLRGAGPGSGTINTPHLPLPFLPQLASLPP